MQSKESQSSYRFQLATDQASGSFEKSTQMQERLFNDIPSFDLSELKIGALLGKGEYCVVRSISKIYSDFESIHSVDNSKLSRDQEQEQEQDFVKGKKMNKKVNFFRRKRNKYAIKYLHEDSSQNPLDFGESMTDLMIETKTLSSMNHPNIIKLHGCSKSNLFTPTYFIIIERLEFTLQEMMQVWRRTKTKKNMKDRFVRWDRKYMKPTLVNISDIVASISSALSYLHGKKVLHRDIKPANIGFNHTGELKLFDFGLSTKMHKEKRTPDGLYQMSGDTGSRRYMAPEVARNDPYNETVDIYSVGIIFWEMLSNEIAFEGYTFDLHESLVVEGGVRPEIDPSWPHNVQDLLRSCWTENLCERPSAQDLCFMLKPLRVAN